MAGHVVRARAVDGDARRRDARVVADEDRATARGKRVDRSSPHPLLVAVPLAIGAQDAIVHARVQLAPAQLDWLRCVQRKHERELGVDRVEPMIVAHGAEERRPLGGFGAAPCLEEHQGECL